MYKSVVQLACGASEKIVQPPLDDRKVGGMFNVFTYGEGVASEFLDFKYLREDCKRGGAIIIVIIGTVPIGDACNMHSEYNISFSSWNMQGSVSVRLLAMVEQFYPFTPIVSSAEKASVKPTTISYHIST